MNIIAISIWLFSTLYLIELFYKAYYTILRRKTFFWELNIIISLYPQKQRNYVYRRKFYNHLHTSYYSIMLFPIK